MYNKNRFRAIKCYVTQRRGGVSGGVSDIYYVIFIMSYLSRSTPSVLRTDGVLLDKYDVINK